ncbi:hypothetical protein L596_013960 [Steinernema carpocapsae]|uniref:Uncharacterized protein n=1 Tax=Steinernema carpocapsae TaxID=34508 RepID=A0A4U5NBE3_STECR|nr:hypothetical protein L596_013960 [Steinernema carpocapsae]
MAISSAVDDKRTSMLIRTRITINKSVCPFLLYHCSQLHRGETKRTFSLILRNERLSDDSGSKACLASTSMSEQRVESSYF